jgi:transcriptional regulator with XRE-family HTH domain
MHLTQSAAAAAAGMQQQTWASIESAPGNLTLDTLGRVAGVVGVEAVLAMVRDRLRASRPGQVGT